MQNNFYRAAGLTHLSIFQYCGISPPKTTQGDYSFACTHVNDANEIRARGQAEARADDAFWQWVGGSSQHHIATHDWLTSLSSVIGCQKRKNNVASNTNKNKQETGTLQLADDTNSDYPVPRLMEPSTSSGSGKARTAS
ncbi:hypothetical protein AMECASPLE_002922 [Ameca splendens]|uniref:Uncharacterized protein n=1 Tax=Ameca splendens TaxID=208324 RepID=A0ABV0XBG8_9TELE